LLSLEAARMQLSKTPDPCLGDERQSEVRACCLWKQLECSFRRRQTHALVMNDTIRESGQVWFNPRTLDQETNIAWRLHSSDTVCANRYGLRHQPWVAFAVRTLRSIHLPRLFSAIEIIVRCIVVVVTSAREATATTTTTSAWCRARSATATATKPCCCLRR
jgi:hypothetical protein